MKNKREFGDYRALKKSKNEKVLLLAKILPYSSNKTYLRSLL